MNAGRPFGTRPADGAGTVGGHSATPEPALDNEPHPALEPALEPARNRFRGLILDRVLAFETHRRQAARGDDPLRALTAISDLAHKISGVGATLGFTQTGKLAGALERSIAQGRAGRSDPMRVHAEIEPLLEALLIEMEARLDD